MEGKKQNNFTGSSRACQPSELSVRKPVSDLQANKPCPRNSRRREQQSTTRIEPQHNSKQYPSVKARPNVDKRPRQRGGGDGGSGGNNFDSSYAADIDEDGIACEFDDVSSFGVGLGTVGEPAVTGALTKKRLHYKHIEYEQYSVYAPGSKKQNLNHLLNFHYAPRDTDNAFRFNVFGRKGGSGATGGATQRYGANGGASTRQRYNKEQFLQANFQFVVHSDVKLNMYASPDTLIDWHLIDQINIQTEEEPQCPICLYPPIAAKLTRCGHAYCWPCILNYLALSDKTWRKCPICYEVIHIADFKSTTIVQQRQFNVDDEITFQLMRRKKGCMMIPKYKPNHNLNNDKYPLLSASNECKRFSKNLIAKRNDILQIIEREHNELNMYLQLALGPCFIIEKLKTPFDSSFKS
ncbi:E3 ubiquitin-protein ligase RNF10-like, partial [Eurosta solidaginis]|uniref:E3 ubiquitin-protein ligase RNF10-like n=1 Tax=Eurosta solidaginis TaxID=178769 RepID=UPI003531375D